MRKNNKKIIPVQEPQHTEISVQYDHCYLAHYT